MIGHWREKRRQVPFFFGGEKVSEGEKRGGRKRVRERCGRMPSWAESGELMLAA